MSALRDRITDYIASSGETARALSFRAGLAEDGVRSILNGRSARPTAETLAALAKCMSTSVRALEGALEQPSRLPEPVPRVRTPKKNKGHRKPVVEATPVTAVRVGRRTPSAVAEVERAAAPPGPRKRPTYRDQLQPSAQEAQTESDFEDLRVELGVARQQLAAAMAAVERVAGLLKKAR